MVFIVRNIELD